MTISNIIIFRKIKIDQKNLLVKIVIFSQKRKDYSLARSFKELKKIIKKKFLSSKFFIFAYDDKAIPLVFCAKIDNFEDDKKNFLIIFFNFLKKVQGYSLAVFAKK